MKRKILLLSIIALLGILTIANIKADTYKVFTNFEIPLLGVANGAIIEKNDDNEQVVKYEAGLFARNMQAKVAAADMFGNLCTTIYKDLKKNKSIYYGGATDVGCAKYHRSNNTAMITIKTASSYNNSTNFNGWWTTTTDNCEDLGC